jgi:hypothetical protein
MKIQRHHVIRGEYVIPREHVIPGLTRDPCTPCMPKAWVPDQARDDIQGQP